MRKKPLFVTAFFFLITAIMLIIAIPNYLETDSDYKTEQTILIVLHIIAFIIVAVILFVKYYYSGDIVYKKTTSKKVKIKPTKKEKPTKNTKADVFTEREDSASSNDNTAENNRHEEIKKTNEENGEYYDEIAKLNELYDDNEQEKR